MTFLLIQAIKNKVETSRSQLPTLPSSSAPAPSPLLLLVNHLPERVQAQPVSPRQAAAGTAGTFPTFNISFWLSSSPCGCIPAGREREKPAGVPCRPHWASPPNSSAAKIGTVETPRQQHL